MKNNPKTTVLSASLMLLGLGFVAGPAVARQQKRLTDSMIRTLVEHKLIKHNLQRQDNIRVSVLDGIVSLSGTVISLAQKDRAEKDAYDVEDVTGVVNSLVIDAGTLSDQETAAEVGRKIRSFVFYDVFDWIQGEVDGGSVTLTGWVREPWRKADYERLAAQVAGVTSINNEIRVLPTSIFDDQLRVRLARVIYGNPTFERYAFQPHPPIHIIVNDGRVFLEGTVNGQLERQLAETIARSESLNLGVVNNLRTDTESKQVR